MTTLSHILLGTPRWVLALFLLLLALGLRQMRDREVTPLRLVVSPLVMTALAIFGVTADFGAQPTPLAAWAVAAILALFIVLRAPTRQRAQYDATTGLVSVSGSAAPLLLMLALFALKYSVAVALSMHPALRQDVMWSLAVAGLYGVFTGLFVGRTVRLGWPLLRTPTAARIGRP